MKLSIVKLLIFFSFLLVVGWLLYPKKVFIGYMYEGLSDLEKSENYYKEFLEKQPYNKFANMRLGRLYVLSGEPEKATETLEQLYLHRYTDWEVAQTYLKHLRYTDNTPKILSAELEVADKFINTHRYNRHDMEELLKSALNNSNLLQQHKKSRRILSQLVKIAKNPEPYEKLLYRMDLAEGKTNRVIASLAQQIKKKPKDKELRLEYIQVCMITKKYKRALNLTNEGLALNPKNLDLLQSKITIHQTLNQYNQAIATTMKLIELSPAQNSKQQL